MDMQIQSTNINYNTNGEVENVRVYFRSSPTNNIDNQININGNVNITKEEYENNKTIDGLSQLVQGKVVESLPSTTQSETETTDDSDSSNTKDKNK